MATLAVRGVLHSAGGRLGAPARDAPAGPLLLQLPLELLRLTLRPARILL
jgi:hypothetical protein